MQAVPSPCDYGVEISRVFLLQWELELEPSVMNSFRKKWTGSNN